MQSTLMKRGGREYYLGGRGSAQTSPPIYHLSDSDNKHGQTKLHSHILYFDVKLSSPHSIFYIIVRIRLNCLMSLVCFATTSLIKFVIFTIELIFLEAENYLSIYF